MLNLIYRCIAILLLVNYSKFQVVNIVDPLIEYKQDICVGTGALLQCKSTPGSNHTPVVTQAFYGINKLNETLCEYRQGDCTEISRDMFCKTPQGECGVYAYYEILTNCSIFAKYLHFKYICIPMESTLLPNHNICNTTLKDITEPMGFISSPNYPLYSVVTGQCTQKIVAPNDKTINIWFVTIDINEENDYNKNCSNDYVTVTDTTGSYTFCGYKKASLENQLCSSVVYISYQAPKNFSAFAYRGFRLYYTFVDRNPLCSTGTPLITTTTTQTQVQTNVLTMSSTQTSTQAQQTTDSKSSTDTQTYSNQETPIPQASIALPLGLGLGLGIPLIILILLTAFCFMKNYKVAKVEPPTKTTNAEL